MSRQETNKNIVKYNIKKYGKIIEYTVKEVKIGTENVDDKGKTKKYTVTQETSENTITITNTHEPEKIDIDVIKKWENDTESTRATVTAELYKGDKDLNQSISLSDKNKWQDSFKGLYKYESGKDISSSYTIKETNIPKGYESSVSGSVEKGFTITNTYVPQTITVTFKNDDGKTVLDSDDIKAFNNLASTNDAKENWESDNKNYKGDKGYHYHVLAKNQSKGGKHDDSDSKEYIVNYKYIYIKYTLNGKDYILIYEKGIGEYNLKSVYVIS